MLILPTILLIPSLRGGFMKELPAAAVRIIITPLQMGARECLLDKLPFCHQGVLTAEGHILFALRFCQVISWVYNV